MIVNENNFFKVLDFLKTKDDLALDTETTGLLFEDKLFSIIISFGEVGNLGGYYFNFNTDIDVDGNLPSCVLPRHWIGCLGALFADPGKTWYLHNAVFDLGMLLKEGVCLLGTIHCTLTTERIIRNNLPSYSLSKLVQNYQIGEKLEDKVKKYITKHRLFTKQEVPGKTRTDRKPHYNKVPFDMIVEYGLKDAELTFKLGRRQRQYINKNQMLIPVATNERKLSSVCAAMCFLGIKLDTAYTKQMFDKQTEELEDLKRQFSSETETTFTRSTKNLLDTFQKFGLRVPLTSKGNPSFSSTVLENINHPIPKLILKIRKLEKFIGTYYSSFLYYKDSRDIIHPSMHQAGTETGRFSYSMPNLQNVPKNPEIRRCFTARNDDYQLVGIDYDQQEYRIMADRAGEKSLIDMVMYEGVDVHTATAKMMDVSRTVAKTVNFMLLYGGGAQKLADTLNISLEEAQVLKNLYFSKLPQIGKFINKVKATGANFGYIHNFLHRRFSCKKDDTNKLPNHLIQGSGADVIKIAMVRLYEYLLPKKSNMILQVHDELLFEIHKREMDILPKIKEIMCDAYQPKNGLELSVEDTFYKNWGEELGQETRNVI